MLRKRLGFDHPEKGDIIEDNYKDDNLEPAEMVDKEGVDYITQGDEIDWNESIIDDKYHILIEPSLGPESIKYVQGARIIRDDTVKTFAVRYEDQEGIKFINIQIASQGKMLSEIFETTPWGLIKKNHTGIGATTLELKAKRHSIIVVPTRALAVSKVVSTGKVEGSEKYKCHYVGSKYQDFSNKPYRLEAYLQDAEIVFKKFIVVSDSLGRLIENIENLGISRKEFFLLVDEIDSYQYDNTYRPNMEKVIDYYFTFPQKKRCMLSATVNEFSNPRIQDEPFINLEFDRPNSRSIRLIHTGSIFHELAQYIMFLNRECPNDKILVAYNSITGITDTINLLDEPLRPQCALYCSENSKDKPGEYYAEFSENRLQKRINFITCTYFVGVDILDQYHLISVSDVSHLYSVLSIDKFTQIAGRCRHKEGLLSETVIYSTFKKAVDYKKDEAELLGTIYRMTKWLEEDRIRIEKFFPDVAFDKGIIEKSKLRYKQYTSEPLLRRNIYGELDISYLNIDALLISMEIRNNLYTHPHALCHELEQRDHRITVIAPQYRERQPGEGQELQEAREEINQNVEEALDGIIEELRSCSPENREAHARRLISARRQHEDFLKLFIQFHEYVPFESLVRVLKQKRRSDNDFIHATTFWALDEQNQLKIGIKNCFNIGERLPAKAYRARIREKLHELFGYESGGDSDTAIMQIWHLYCEDDRIKSRKHGYDFVVKSYNPLGYEGEPLKRFPFKTSPQDYFPPEKLPHPDKLA